MMIYADKTNDDKSRAIVNDLFRNDSGGKSSLQRADIRLDSGDQGISVNAIDNSPRVAQLRVYKQMVNSSQLQKTIQMMAKEKGGSEKYIELQNRKDAIDVEIANNASSGEERKARALDELNASKDSQLKKYGVEKSYTPFYKNNIYSQDLRTAWRMCEDIRKNSDPMHVHETRLEIDAYVDRSVARMMAKEGKNAYALRQKSNEIIQL